MAELLIVIPDQFADFIDLLRFGPVSQQLILELFMLFIVLYKSEHLLLQIDAAIVNLFLRLQDVELGKALEDWLLLIYFELFKDLNLFLG